MCKICHVSSAHPQEDVRIFEKECVSLAEAGYKVYLVSQGANQIKKEVIFKGAGQRPANRLIRMILFTRKVYKIAICINADLYHFHDPELLPFALKMHKKGKKVIFDSHEFTALQISGGARDYIPKPIRKIAGIIYKNYERYILRRIDGVIIPCLRHGQDYFEGNYKRIEYVNNVPRLSDLKYNPNITKIENSTGYVGSIAKERGIVNSILASYRAGCSLQLIGNMNKGLYNELCHMEAFKSVHYYGKQSVKEFCQILQKTQVGLCLLKNVGQYDEGDNLSTKVYEYMALGLPVVVSDFRINKQIIEENECGLCVNPENCDEIVRAIKILIRDKKLAEQMGRNGRRLVEKYYCWEVEEKKLLKLYADVFSV